MRILAPWVSDLWEVSLNGFNTDTCRVGEWLVGSTTQWFQYVHLLHGWVTFGKYLLMVLIGIFAVYWRVTWGKYLPMVSIRIFAPWESDLWEVPLNDFNADILFGCAGIPKIKTSSHSWHHFLPLLPTVGTTRCSLFACTQLYFVRWVDRSDLSHSKHS